MGIKSQKNTIEEQYRGPHAPKGDVATDLRAALYVVAQKYQLNFNHPQTQGFIFYALQEVGYKEKILGLSVDTIKNCIDDLVKKGALIKLDDYDVYLRPDHNVTSKCKICRGDKNSGIRFVIKSFDKSTTYRVESKFLISDGDEVEAIVVESMKTAFVTEIISKRTAIIGYVRYAPADMAFDPHRQHACCYILEPCDSSNTTLYPFTYEKDLNGAKEGDIVIAAYSSSDKTRLVVKKVVKDLGKYNGIILSAILKYDIPSVWPDNLLKSLYRVPDEVDAKDIKDRVDVRDLPLVTIDGEDARDFDDAVYCKKEGDKWRLYVAIADVSYYVKSGTLLDKEALNRCNSVYFPNYVIPMLPKKLSNGICSLNPNVDRLCMVCEMLIDKKGSIESYDFYAAVMRSHARLTYTIADEMIEKGTCGQHKEFEILIDNVKELHNLYKVFKKARENRGVISIEGQEVHIVFDEHMEISSIEPYERNDAHMLIEECMIAANVAAATFVEKNASKTLYRVHAKPSEKKLDVLRVNLARFGLSLGGADSPSNQDFAKLYKEIEGRDSEDIIGQLILQSMSKAVYTPDNIGHFGLALDKYAHFTSPIRRYPDLQLHRVIKYILQKKQGKKYGKIGARSYTKEELVQLGSRCTDREIAAAQAEYDVDNELKCEFLKSHIGDVVDGVITAIAHYGIFVRLTQFYIDGMIFVGNLPEGYMQDNKYITNKKKYDLSVGAKIKVRIAAVDSRERKIDLLLGDDKRKSTLETTQKTTSSKKKKVQEPINVPVGEDFDKALVSLFKDAQNEPVEKGTARRLEKKEALFEAMAREKREGKKTEETVSDPFTDAIASKELQESGYANAENPGGEEFTQDELVEYGVLNEWFASSAEEQEALELEEREAKKAKKAKKKSRSKASNAKARAKLDEELNVTHGTSHQGSKAGTKEKATAKSTAKGSAKSSAKSATKTSLKTSTKANVKSTSQDTVAADSAVKPKSKRKSKSVKEQTETDVSVSKPKAQSRAKGKATASDSQESKVSSGALGASETKATTVAGSRSKREKTRAKKAKSEE